MFAALNSIESFVQNFVEADATAAKESWATAWQAVAGTALRKRLESMNHWLEGREYLEEDRFTAGDLMMSSVLRDLADTKVLREFANVAKYRQRCYARPAFVKALNAQMEMYENCNKNDPTPSAGHR